MIPKRRRLADMQGFIWRHVSPGKERRRIRRAIRVLKKGRPARSARIIGCPTMASLLWALEVKATFYGPPPKNRSTRRRLRRALRLTEGPNAIGRALMRLENYGR